MAVIWMDSFDHYSSLDQKGWIIGHPNAYLNTGRFGNCLECNNAGGGNPQGNVLRRLPNNLTYTTLYMGWAFMVPGGGTDSLDFVRFMGNNFGANVLRLSFNSANKFQLRNAAGTILGTSPAGIGTNVWTYMEMMCVVSATVGQVELKQDGVSIISATNVNTGAIPIDGFAMQYTSNYTKFDDLVITDSNFIGDVRVQALLPSGNGNSSQLLGNDGNSTDNYLLVDEATPNGDTDYVESSTTGDKDTYAYGNLTPTTGIVHAVQILPYMRKTDAGSRLMATVARVGTTESDGPSQILSNSYQYQGDIRNAKPGGGAWTISDVNAAEFGVKVVALPPVLVSSQYAGGTATDSTTTLTPAPTAGNQRLVVVACRNGGAISVSGFTTVRAGHSIGGGAGATMASFRRTIQAGDSASAIGHTGGNDYPTNFDVEIGNVTALTDNFLGSGTGVALGVTGSITPTSGWVLVIDDFMIDYGEPSTPGTLTQGAGWTLLHKTDGAGYGPHRLIQYGVFAYDAIPASNVLCSATGPWAGERFVYQ